MKLSFFNLYLTEIYARLTGFVLSDNEEKNVNYIKETRKWGEKMK